MKKISINYEYPVDMSSEEKTEILRVISSGNFVPGEKRCYCGGILRMEYVPASGLFVMKCHDWLIKCCKCGHEASSFFPYMALKDGRIYCEGCITDNSATSLESGQTC